MKRETLLLSFFILLSIPMCSFGQAWSGIISPGRAIDWSKAGISGGIPNRTKICVTLNPGATGAQINSAIAGCGNGQVVFLNAGTYNLSAGITFNNKSNVTLRGAGADQTKLVFSKGAPTPCHGLFANVCIDSADLNWPGGPSNTADWTAGYAKGTTQITLSTTPNLAVGSPLILDQLDDATDNGAIYVCEAKAGGCNDDGPNGGPSGGQRDSRAQQQMVTVTAIKGNQVTISPGLYMPNWRSSQKPGAWWASNPAFSDGIEDLSLDHTSSDEQSGMTIFNCSGCWVRGIRSINSAREHVWVFASPKTIVRDSYFYGTKNAVSQSYGVECFSGSSDILVENNIFQHITSPQMINSGCSGAVVSYNYSIDDFFAGSPVWMMQAAFLHAAGLDTVLLEGNTGAGIWSDNFHGTHHFVTLFRNRYNGWETGKTDNIVAMNLHPYSRFFNLIGNVLGELGRQTSYEQTPSGGNDAAVYLIGTGGTDVKDDPVTVQTLMRWGNYDTVNKAVRFQSSEVPSGINQFANPVPVSQNLPASLYLASRPNFWATPWGTPAWPPIGPDVTGGDIANVAGHAYKIPAQLCFENSPAESNGILAFNARKCYGAQSGTLAPAAPTGLTAVVH